jgi:hypothetical protein
MFYGRSVPLADAEVEPLTAAELRTHSVILNSVDADNSDAYLGELITAARRAFELQTSLALIEQTWLIWFDAPAIAETLGWWDGVRDGPIDLPRSRCLQLLPSPVLAIDAVTTYAPSGASAVWAASNYFLDSGSKPARLVLVDGVSWPTNLRAKNALSVSISAGYGEDATDVPLDVKHAIRTGAAFLYENRGASLSGEAGAALSRLLKPTVDRYRIRRL